MILKNAVGKEFDLSELNEPSFLNDNRNHCQLISNQINDGIYDFVKPLVNKSSRVFDIGGNIGYFSYYTSPLVKQIHAFEPTPETFRVLQKMKNTSHLDNVTIHNKAVSVENGHMEFYIYNSNQTMNSLKKMENIPHNIVKVETVSLLDIVNQYETVDFVKLDIEGGEKRILMDDSFDFIANKVKNVFVEIHEFDTFGTPWWAQNMEINIEQGYRTLTNAGYSVERISYDGLLAKKV